MKRLAQYLFLILLLCSCDKKKVCEPCQQFLESHKPFKYEMQKFSYARGLAFPGNHPSQWYEDLHNPKGEIAIMESKYYTNIEDSLFCFTNMRYENVMKHFPSTADSIKMRPIDAKTVLIECTLNVGDWDLIRLGEKNIPFSGDPALKLLFNKENKELIYTGGKVSREKHERCLCGE